MSNIYITEPPTKGKVLLHTSFGDVDVELWPKEAPKAVRNFVQLALDGYYDGTIFHRIIRDFMVQGGDPTGTGQGGESIYGGGGFPDEVHQRLKFNHRGQVAMANENSPSTNRSQFFITLGKCQWLDGKHTIFGKVTGATIFNVLRAGEFATDKDDRPLEPPVLKSIEVLANPYPDIVQRRRKVESEEKDEAPVLVKKKKKKKKRNLGLLSFGEEAGDELAAAEQSGRVGMKSTHDVVKDDRRLSKQKAYADAEPSPGTSGGSKTRGAVRERGDAEASAADTASSFAAAMKARIHGKKRPRPADGGTPASATVRSTPADEDAAAEASRSKARARQDKKARREEERRRTKEELRKLREEIKSKKKAAKVGSTGAKRAEEDSKRMERELLAPLQQTRAKYLARKKKHGSREKDTLARLAAFTAKFRSVAATRDEEEGEEDKGRTADAGARGRRTSQTYSGQVLDDSDDDDPNDDSWMKSSLKFVKHVDDALRQPGAITSDPLANQHKRMARDTKRRRRRH